MKKADALAALSSVEVGAGLDNQIGSGVDIVEVARVRAVLARTQRFAWRVYTEGERAYCDAHANPEVHYATRFAAKEAVAKVLGVGLANGVDPRDIEVKRNAKGRPYVDLHGKAKQRACDLGIVDLPLSLSYTHTEAVACAMGITETATAPAREADPMQELSRQFKELRGMFDEADKAAQTRAASGDTQEAAQKGA